MGTSGEPQWVHPPDFFDGTDFPRAVAAAESVAKGLLKGLVDPVVWFGEVKTALEVLCDAPGGSPGLAFRAVKASESRFRAPELWEEGDVASNAVRFSCWATLLAEVAHRNRRYAEAVVITSAGLDKLESVAGGRDALLDLVRSPLPEPVAVAVTPLYAIRIAALRRADYPPATLQFLRERTRGIVPAFLASDRRDPRTHAFATQSLFDGVEQGELHHAGDLREISDETRGTSLRAQTTAPLVAMEHARASGDIATAKREALEAERRIREFGLERHLRVIQERRYLVFD